MSPSESFAVQRQSESNTWRRETEKKIKSHQLYQLIINTTKVRHQLETINNNNNITTQQNK